MIKRLNIQLQQAPVQQQHSFLRSTNIGQTCRTYTLGVEHPTRTCEEDGMLDLEHLSDGCLDLCHGEYDLTDKIDKTKKL